MPYATENMLNSCSTEAKLSHSTNTLWKRNSPKPGFQIIFNTNTLPLTACIWVSRMHNSVKLKASSSEQHLCSYVNFKVLPKGAHSKAPCFKTFRHFKATFANSKPGSLFSKPLAFRNLALSGLTALLWLVMLLTAEDSATGIVITSQIHWETLNSFSPKVASICTLPAELSEFWKAVKSKKESWGIIKFIPLSQCKIQISQGWFS